MAERAGSHTTEIDSSHAALVSHPDVVSDLRRPSRQTDRGADRVTGSARWRRLGAPPKRPGARRATLSVMSVRLIFRCQFCDARADPITQLSLEQAMRQITWGAYQDALPGRWLVFHGRGLYGSARYACPDHRGDLVAYLREHFGTIGSHVWKRPPYPSSLAHAGTDHAWISATQRKGGAAF